MKLSIIVPCYNESTTILQVIEKLQSFSFDHGTKEIIIIDDCSTDSSRKLLETIPRTESLKVFFKEQNGGKGSAVKYGSRHITGDFVIIQDADLEYDPQDIPSLIEPLITNKADVVYGSRFLENKSHYQGAFHFHKHINHVLTFIFKLTNGMPTTDMHTCYKAYKKNIFKNIVTQIVSDDFSFDTELAVRTAKKIKKGLRFCERPISYYPRMYHEGKKITWRDGIKSIVASIQFSINC